ncbi:ferrous iron transport protein B [Iocasia frigidifontis]|uniref:Ferrous iron transport protein B n=1 Tax=Iocasia fonsfrigidae TaxID=2682810 RepID=A0A8A7KGF8_9FIRM|nr:ferrous iron transport protein B [Iocasia fonsfrigidae]QTL99175.1 ferrous iron transport protein B [Iocasia fonsfrigidae]
MELKSSYPENNIVIALAGNPNSGKTSMFNQLTGARQHVGNWPGVTVERKEGTLKYKDNLVNVVDLPGTYSLGAYSEDEVVAKDFLLYHSPDVTVNIVDTTNLQRNLYLTLQLLEMGANTVLALNMYDQVEKRQQKIDIDKLSSILGIPVVKTSASKGEGVTQLVSTAVNIAGRDKKPLEINYGNELEEEIKSISEIVVMNNELKVKYNIRWLALKILEQDEHILEDVEHRLSARQLEEIKKCIQRIESKTGEESDTIIADMRYGFINELIEKTVKKSKSVEEKVSFSDKIDGIVTNRYLGIPIFLLAMWSVFKITFALGDPMIGWVEEFFAFLGTLASNLLLAVNASDFLVSLIVDGIIGGVGSVLVFIPNIFLLFLCISILEDSGYLARAAYVMDRLMSSFGLHGKSFIPLLIGFGCNVPGVMATRTLENKSDRMITILVNSFMSCSARLPVYVVFAGVFFPGNEGNVIFSLYVLGILVAIVMAKLFKSFLFKGAVSPFVLELPQYRMPSLKGTIIHMWERGRLFIKKAGTLIFSVVVLIWLLSSLPLGVEYASQHSFIGKIGSFLSPLFAPLGLGNWQSTAALIFGILAKEVVVGTLGVVYSVGESGLSTAIAQNFTALSAYSLMVLTLLYTPCVATLGAIKRETNSWKWTIFSAIYTFVIAWIIAFIIYQLGSLLY